MPSVAALEYAAVPDYAALLPAKDEAPSASARPPQPRRFSLDALSSSLISSSSSDKSSSAGGTNAHARNASANISSSTSSQTSYLTSLLISSAMNIPASQSGSSPRGPTHTLMSTKDPLSIPITTSNSRRFVSRVGVIFWILDRGEEVLMWRKGWKYTGAWVVGYSAICMKPWLLLMVPNVALMTIMLMSYHPTRSPKNTTGILDPSQSAALSSPPPGQATSPVPGVVPEGSTAWLANVQGLQNLMGFISDQVDIVTPFIPLLTFQRRASTPLFLVLLLTTLPLAIFPIPLNLVLLFAGLALFTATHPVVRHIVLDPQGLVMQSQLVPYVQEQVRGVVNDFWLAEECIVAGDLKDVEIYQNERWAWPTSDQKSASGGNVMHAGWRGGVANLKPSDRGGWTRGSDGSVTVGEDSSRISVDLDPGWAFVETEDWEPDFLARWAPNGADRDGWVYTNDAWLDSRPAPVEEWQKAGMTRRRRWTRRVYRKKT